MVRSIFRYVEWNFFKPYKIMLGALGLTALALVIFRPILIKLDNEDKNILQKSLIRARTIITTKDSGMLNSIHINNKSDVNAITNNEQLPYKEALLKKFPNTYDKNIISNDDNGINILTRYFLNTTNFAELSNQNGWLCNLRIGSVLTWELNKDKQLRTLTWMIAKKEARIYTRKSSFSNIFIEEKQICPLLVDKIIQGRISANFISSVINAGLTYNEACELSKVLQCKIGLAKLKSGDRFSVLLSREMLHENNEQNRLLGVHLLSNGKNYYFFRTENGLYYDTKDNGINRGFLRYPTSKVFRVSSPFSLERINPVTGRPAPHQGVDFSMPVGTPILAVGDGEVIVAKYSGAAGNFITIRHGCEYITRYMHLRKLLVKPGQKVKRGEHIALSGNTGRTTGPHLHYELWFNQRAVNPLTANLPKSGGLTEKDRKLFWYLLKRTNQNC